MEQAEAVAATIEAERWSTMEAGDKFTEAVAAARGETLVKLHTQRLHQTVSQLWHGSPTPMQTSSSASLSRLIQLYETPHNPRQLHSSLRLTTPPMHSDCTACVRGGARGVSEGVLSQRRTVGRARRSC